MNEYSCHKAVLLALALGVFSAYGLPAQAAAQSDPARPLRLGHINLGDEDYYLPLPLAYTPTTAGPVSGSGSAGYQLRFFPEGQTAENWTEQLTLSVFKPGVSALDQTRAALAHSCAGLFSNYVAPPPVFLTPPRAVVAAVMNCSETGQAGGPTVYGYYLAIGALDHAYLLTRERREAQPDHYADWGAHEVDRWRKAMAGFTVCPKGVVCIRYPEKTTVVELGSGQ